LKQLRDAAKAKADKMNKTNAKKSLFTTQQKGSKAAKKVIKRHTGQDIKECRNGSVREIRSWLHP